MEKTIMALNWRDALKGKKPYSIDNDFILLENPIITPAFSYPFKVDVVSAVICKTGTMKGSVNLKRYVAKAPCMFIVLPNQILQYEEFSDDFTGLFVVMTSRFTDTLLNSVNERFPVKLSVYDNPFIPLNGEAYEAMITYYNLMKRAVSLTDNPNRLEMVRLLTAAFFYGAGYYFHKSPEQKTKTKQDRLVESFLELVEANYKRERGVEFYADKLCLTPKYLSKVIKETSGESANQWINNYVILEAKALLKSTTMTVQQISDELNFPSQSFFGKYFKRLVGVPPKEYKKN